jgi:nitric oxide reductase NorQ protein
MDNIVKYGNYAVTDKVYYEPVGNEVTNFKIAYECRLPVSLIGPTGCGKTTLAMKMAYELNQRYTQIDKNGNAIVADFPKAENQLGNKIAFPYIEIPCHEDLTETHLVGRYNFNDEWLPGPLYTAAKNGGMVVLDEIVEARKDAIVLLHGLTDDRRVLYISKKNEIITPPEDFMVVICYNPGYQFKTKDLKPSTRQRFTTINMDYPSKEIESKIIKTKTGIDTQTADRLVDIANEIRDARNSDQINLDEGASTRLLIYAAKFYQKCIDMKIEPDFSDICRINIFNPISSEDTDREILEEILKEYL